MGRGNSLPKPLLENRMRDSPIEIIDGKANWEPRFGDFYIVTGVDVKGKRFKIMSQNWFHARSINVYKGSIWLLRSGKRHLIKRIYN